MYINKVITFNSAWDILLKKEEEYEDICSSISQLNKTILTNPKIISTTYKKIDEENPEISPYNFIRCWEHLMKGFGWEGHRLQANTAGGINIYIKHLKNGVASKIMPSDQMRSFPSWVLFESPKIVGTEFCDLSVLIVPMESEENIYNNPKRLGPKFNFEKSLIQLNDLLPLNQKEPFLIIGISSKEEKDIEFFDFQPDKSENLIERVLEFSKEHYQAGIGILSYFGEIIKQKYPDIDAKVRIEQDGDIVRMIVDTPDGTRDIIEQTLNKYALVISRKAEPDSLLEDKLQIHKLTSKLDIAELEVRQTRDLLKISENYSVDRIQSLEDDINFLRGQIGSQMHHMDKSQVIIHQQSKKEEKIFLTQMENSKKTIEDLLFTTNNHSELKNALLEIQKVLEKGANKNDENNTKLALEKIMDSSPETFNDLSEALKNTAYGVSGNIVFQWLQQIASIVA